MPDANSDSYANSYPDSYPERNSNSDSNSVTDTDATALHGRHVDSNQHHQRARCPIRAHCSVDRERDDRLGRNYRGLQLFVHRRAVQSEHR